MFWAVASTVIAMIMAITMIFYRLKAAKKPATVKKIILPPVFMSTGAFMFLFPTFQVSFMQVVEAIVVGMIFSLFLIKTSNFEIKDKEIYLIPSKAFAFILFGLLGVRIIAKLIINSQISLGETSGMFFLLAFGMIGTWRLAMLYKFKKIEKNLKKTPRQARRL
ncbi:cytochrome c biogenesis protein CcdC [Virgibacillus sp. MSJ-26]|uniref:CcdC family protein n=1 Tax=Virgibacillus sp. MSJ-26 TaxID=2841522 RepID=UPI001C0FB718|nr:cytochrome c biogenesis protein CcdC [Virgibacillus sp. MSJ-26]MBU5466680.1 cytochrome c biogenesis protein CcdC [Virgibacillus sp. MSJ-26]